MFCKKHQKQKTLQRRAWQLLVLSGHFIFFFLGMANAYAAGMFLPGKGVIEFSRGGASVAGYDSLNSLWHNPANLVEAKGLSFLVDANLIIGSLTFTRAARTGNDGKTITYDPVSNEGAPLPIPSIIGAYGWKKHGLTIAFGIYAPNATAMKFPDTGSQRYALIDMAGSLLLLTHLAAAWSPHPRFRIGLGLQNYTVNIRIITAASGYLGAFGGPEDKNLDLYTQIELSTPLNLSGNIGLWGRLLDMSKFKLDMGLSAQLPVQIKGGGKVRLRLPTHAMFDPVTVEGEQVSVGFWLPLNLRGGIRATISDRFNVELAFVYENWKVHDKMLIQPTGSGIWLNNVPAIGRYKIPDISVERAYQDTYSIRMGGEVKVLPNRLKIRVGYAFETSAAPEDMATVLLYDSLKHLFAFGASIQFGNMFLDLSYAFLLLPTRDIINSRYKQLNPLNPEGAVVIGNGRYSANFHMLGVAWRGHF